MVRVLVAADSEPGRVGLEALVEHGDSLRVIGSSTAGIALPARVRALAPDVILLEPPVLEDDAFALWLARVSDAAAGVPLIFVGSEVLRTVARELLHAGVRGLLSYDATKVVIAPENLRQRSPATRSSKWLAYLCPTTEHRYTSSVTTIVISGFGPAAAASKVRPASPRTSTTSISRWCARAASGNSATQTGARIDAGVDLCNMHSILRVVFNGPLAQRFGRRMGSRR